MDLGIALTVRLTVIYAEVLFYMVTKQSNVTNVICGYTMNALSSQNLNSMLVKNTQIAYDFVQNATFPIFRIHSSQSNSIWKIKIGLLHWQRIMEQKTSLKCDK